MPVVRIATYTNYQLLQDGLFHILSAEPAFLPLPSSSMSVDEAPAACDVALLDSQLDEALLRCTQLTQHGAGVIFVGVADDYEWSMDALRAGARGLVNTGVRAEALIRAIRAVHQGDLWIPEQLMRASIERAARFSDKRPSGNAAHPLSARLSTREREVFRYAATGLSNRDLAELLHISEATVKVHLANIFAKLRLRGRAELAAAYHGILHQDRAGRPTAVSR